MVTLDSWSQAQHSVLGSVLIDGRCAPLVISGTTEADYTGPSLVVFKTIKELFGKGQTIDPVIVASRLDKAYANFLMQLMEITPTAAHVEDYITLCREQSRLMRLRDLGAQLAEAESLEDAGGLLEQANSASMQRVHARIVTMEDAMSAFFERHEGEKVYLSWPIAGLNERLYAEPGDFIVLGGYPSDGKSALAIQMAYHMSKQHRVGFFSLETNPNKLFDRMIAHVAQIPMDLMKTNKMREQDWEAAARVSDEIIGRNLHYIPAAGMTVSDIQALTRINRYDVIFVDYLQLISGRAKDRFALVTEVSIGLHTMAQSSGVAVVALAQLRRPESKKADGKVYPPQLSDLRESGQIEQDADIVFMVYRPDPKKSGRELLVRKNKEGRLGEITLDFDGRYQTFRRAVPPPSVPAYPVSEGSNLKEQAAVYRQRHEDLGAKSRAAKSSAQSEAGGHMGPPLQEDDDESVEYIESLFNNE